MSKAKLSQLFAVLCRELSKTRLPAISTAVLHHNPVSRDHHSNKNRTKPATKQHQKHTVELNQETR